MIVFTVPSIGVQEMATVMAREELVAQAQRLGVELNIVGETNRPDLGNPVPLGGLMELTCPPSTNYHDEYDATPRCAKAHRPTGVSKAKRVARKRRNGGKK